jgi:tRNA (adenine57-N1/adenine58-N1)-methyltransferase
MRFLGAKGTLISYERREEFVATATSNIEEFKNLYGDPGATHKIVLGDVYEAIDEDDLDMVVLDVPEPHRALPSVLKSLRAGGTILCWLPTVTQVYLLVRSLQDNPGWTGIETRETLQRSWDVAENAMRPYHRMVGHTGFLIRARKLECPDEASRDEADNPDTE